MPLRIRFIAQFIASDLKRSRSRFAFVILAFAIGVGILVAVSGISANLGTTINSEAKSLLAADLSVSSSEKFPEEVLSIFPSEGVARATEVTFASMLTVPKSEARSRLVQVRGIKGNYPFYGEVQISPANGLQALRSSGGALVDQSLARQFEMVVGDPVKLGKKEFTIVGVIQKFPGESYARTVIAPKIFVSFDEIVDTELLQRGSRVTYKEHLAFNSDEALKETIERLKIAQPKYRFELETVESRKERIGRVLNDVSKFLALISFIAILLGGVGVGSAMYTYVSDRREVIASMRCIGATAKQIIVLYLFQGVVVALIGTVVGIAFGLGLQHLLPRILGEFLPISFDVAVSSEAVSNGFTLGFLISIIFCAWPLLGVLAITPLQAIRDDDETPSRTVNVYRSSLAIAGLALFMVVASVALKNVKYGIGFVGALVLLVVLLLAVGTAFSELLKRLKPSGGGFALRYGIASIHRPHNQTRTLVITLGISAFLLSTVFLARGMLLNQVTIAGSGTRPNLILFDVQSDQRAGIRQLATEHTIAISQEVPIVTMRLLQINGRDNLEIRADPEIPEWTLRREYRSSYRSELIESESIVEGEFVPSFTGQIASDVIPVTAEEGIARDLKIKLGDMIVFDVQGVTVRSVIVGIRKVDWRRVQTNFFFLFPSGVLEDAPQFYALMARANSSDSLDSFQRVLVERYGNVSAIDLNLILETADELLGKIATAVQFLALFTVFAGLLVLAGAIATTRSARLKELLLLRTVGASRNQMLGATFIEFSLLGLSATIIGIGASIFGSYTMSIYFFESTFVLPLLPLSLILAFIYLLVVGMGMISTLALLKSSPVEILRVS